MSERKPRICIGVPMYGKVDPELVEDWMRWAFHLGRRCTSYDFFIAIRSKSEQFRARNAIVDAARTMDCDYLLMLDDDMIIDTDVTGGPNEAYSWVERLIAHDKDLIGALYYQRTGGYAPVLMTATSANGYRFLRDDEVTHGLQQVDVAGGGALLIKMRVFDKIPMPFFEPEFQFGTDVQVCRKAKECGFEVWADTSIELGHLKDERTIITSRNRRQFQLSTPVPGEYSRLFVASDVYQELIADAVQHTGYPDVETMNLHASKFMQGRKASGLADADWYKEFPRERVARQVCYNTQAQTKRGMNEFILTSINHAESQRILDFGCGIGVTAFYLAQRGHRVTACDLEGTGTFEFLKWRAKYHGVEMTFHTTKGEVPALGGAVYDIIIAMDCLEHIPHWRDVLRELASHLKPGGILFCNNGILDDKLHPEHYDMDTKVFVKTCIDHDLMPFNPIGYVKKEQEVHAEIPHSLP